MRAAIAALRRIAECQQEALVAARQRLQPHVARRGKAQRLARQVAGFRLAGAVGLDQPLVPQDVGHTRHRRHRLVGARRGDIAAAVGQAEIQQPMRIVVGGTEHLPAGQILEHRRDAPPDPHRRGIDRQRVREARQCRAIGAQQESRLDQIALRLLHGQRGKFPVVQRTFAHRAIHAAAELTLDLRQRQFRHRRIAAPLLGQPGMRIVDRLLAALDRDIGHRSDLLDRHAARQRGERRAGAQDDVHAARILRMVPLPGRGKVRRQAARRQQRGFAQTRPGQAIARAGSQRGDLQDQRRGTLPAPRACRPAALRDRASTAPRQTRPCPALR